MGSASPPNWYGPRLHTYHELYNVLGVKTQDAHTHTEFESFSGRRMLHLFKLNPGLNTFAPEVESPLPASSEIKVLSCLAPVAGAFSRGCRAGNPDRQIGGDSGRL